MSQEIDWICKKCNREFYTKCPYIRSVFVKKILDPNFQTLLSLCTWTTLQENHFKFEMRIDGENTNDEKLETVKEVLKKLIETPDLLKQETCNHDIVPNSSESQKCIFGHIHP